MATRNAAINFNINVGNPQALSKMAMDMNKFEQSAVSAGTKASGAMNQYGNAVTQASQKSAAAAVNFQTMGQGMLNLSTAGVQTFTSFSNLDRAFNRAEASAVGLQRAEDLLARKQLALDLAIQQTGESSRKSQLAAAELATAYADIAVKADKAKIEQAAVLDVQLLFIANIANVAISSLMIYRTAFEGVTLSIIKNKVALVANRIATKLHTFALNQSTIAARSSAVSMTGLTIGLGGATAATISLKGAVRSLLITLGPVGAIIIGISVAMQAYEENWGGFKDTLNDFLGIQEKVNEELKTEEELLREAAAATQGLDESTSKLPTTYEAARIALANYRQELKGIKEDQIEYYSLQDLINRQQKTSDFSAGVKSTPKTFWEKLSSFGTMPSSYAENFNSTAVQSSGINFNNLSTIDFTKVEHIDSVSNDLELFLMSPTARTRTIKAISLNKFMKALESGSEFLIPSLFDFSSKYDPAIGGDFLIPEEDKAGFSQADWRWYRNIKNGDPTTLTRDQRNKFMKMDKLMGRSGGKESIERSKALSKLTNREFARQVIGFDIGAVGDRIDRSDALRLAIIEKEMANGNFTTFNASEIAYRKTAGINDFLSTTPTSYRNLVRGEGFTGFFGKGFFNSTGASAAYQTGGPGQQNTEEIEARDAYANSGIIQGFSILASLQNGLGGISTANPLSRTASRSFRSMNISQMLNLSPNTQGLGIGTDMILDAEFSLIRERFPDLGVNSARNRSNLRASISATLEAIGRSTDRQEAIISSGLGISVDFNAPLRQVKVGTYRGGGNIYKYYSTKPSAQAQIRADIAASGDIDIPSGGRLLELTHAFNSNGNFSNFNNTGLTSQAQSGLGITEQQVFDIRFNSTRGDRELLNRLRFVEAQEAASSGTSPL